MPKFLILKLQGAMQAWGGHTYEDYRPSLIFPTRSAVVGLLGACLGLEREKPAQLKALNDSFEFALTVSAHARQVENEHLSARTFKLTGQTLSVLKEGKLPEDVLKKLAALTNQEIRGEDNFLHVLNKQIGEDKAVEYKSRLFKEAGIKRKVSRHKITDYHTVLDARRSDGGKRDDAIVSRREYLCDAEFTLALSFKDQAAYGLEEVSAAVKKPHYTPYLGRRSCPLQRPLFAGVTQAETAGQALRQLHPEGTLYSETELPQSYAMTVRDQPLFTGKRRFVTRTVYVVGG